VIRAGAIPDALRARPQWVTWRSETRAPDDSKPTKVPYNVRTGEKASTTDPRTWSPFEAACAAADGYDGIGYVFAPDDPHVGIDLDGCRDPETGAIEAWAVDILGDTRSYTEVSPSGEGLHVYVLGSLPPGRRRHGPVEMYDQGRYFTVTGQRLDELPPDIQKPVLPLAELHAKLLPVPPASPIADNGHPTAGAPDLDDFALLLRAQQAANGAKFRALWAGETAGYSSASEADQALCNHLAFWTGRDAARMDRLFRQSALWRSKWDQRRGEGTYGARTIERAIEGCREVYRAGAPRPAAPGGTLSSSYIETIAEFLDAADPPLTWLFPELLPAGVLMLLHGEPRAKKSLVAFELALAAATGTPPFGLARFRPGPAVPVFYIQEEDPRTPTKARLDRLVRERCGPTRPATLHVAIRQGVDLDDPAWVEQIITDCQRLHIRLLVFDAARRLSIKTDEGPAKVRELMAALRAIVTRAEVTIIIVHHDIKPPVIGQDLRRRSQRASGGDWFAGSECPVHVERVDARESLVYPQDYKFSADPIPFTFSCELDGRLITRLVGRDTTTDHAETAGERGKLLEWLRTNGPAAKTAMKKAGFGWATLTALLDGLMREGLVDMAPGRKKGSSLYFVVGQPSQPSQDGSTSGTHDAA